MDNVIAFDNGQEIKTPDEVLEEARGVLEDVIVLGIEPSGELYVTTSGVPAGHILFMIEALKKDMMEQFFG